MGSIEKRFILVKGLLCFIEVVCCGQIKKAAENLRMKQSNLSTQIGELEDELKVVLLNRHPRGVTMTRSGEEVFKISSGIAKVVNDIQTFSTKTHKLSGEVRLWVSEGMGSSYIPSCLTEFYKKFPDVHLSLTSSLEDPTSLADFDVAVVYHEPHFNNAFEMCKGALNFYLYASKEYLIRKGCPKNIDDLLENHSLCLRTDFHTLWPEQKAFFDNAKNIAIETDSSNMLFNLVNSGLGISFIPSCIAQTSQNLMPILQDEIHISHPFWLICPHHLKDVPKIRALMEHLQEIASKL